MLDSFFFWALFGILVIICAFAQYIARRKILATPASSVSSEGTTKESEKDDASSNKGHSTEETESCSSFLTFQRHYLLVYYIVMEADWLQGPYVYALYSYYNFSKEDIALLFIAGFTSSMLFGTFIGSIADKYGRKNLCMAFGVIYSLSCITKLVPDFTVLLIGRLLAGIATSLLFSTFEAWMVFEHFKNGFTPKSLSDTFSLATFGNGIAAIVAGLLASLVAEYFGFVAPFMLAMAFLILATAIVYYTWGENYGDATIDVRHTLMNGLRALRDDPKILLLGCIQSLFEGSMYVFVFMWTPALTEDPTVDGTALPYGLIFACYMVCIMIGSSVFTMLVNRGVRLETIGTLLLLTAAFALSLPAIFTEAKIIIFGFLLFELCCGLYFPCFGTLRGKYIPEDSRATLMNFFRVPLNFLVVIVLLKVSYFANSTVFIVTTVWLLFALALTRWFVLLVDRSRMVVET